MAKKIKSRSSCVGTAKRVKAEFERCKKDFNYWWHKYVVLPKNINN